MNPSRIIAVLAATLILFLPVAQWPDEVAAQTTCVQHNIYNVTNGNNIVPWPQNATVHISYDPNGTQGAGTGDPPSAWNLTNQGVSDFGTDWWNGLGMWNLFSSGLAGSDNSGIHFEQNTEGSEQDNWEVTTAWPTASFHYWDSSGTPHSGTITVNCPSPCLAVAQTFYFPDVGAGSGSAAGALTMINTNGTYTVNGNTYNFWNASCEEASGCTGTNASNFSSAMFDTAEHEAGHGMNLGDVTTGNSPSSPCDDVMSQWGVATPSNPTAGVNNGGGCQTPLPNSCDVTEVKAGYHGNISAGTGYINAQGEFCETSNEPSVVPSGSCFTHYTTTYNACNGKELPGYPVTVDDGTACYGE